MEGKTELKEEDRDNRECNVIVYGKLESDEEKWEKRKTNDLAFIQELFKEGLGLEELDVVLHHRLGAWKHECQQQRPIKVVLASVDQRDSVLSRGYRLSKDDGQFKSIRLSADLTIDERKELSSLRQKAKQLTAEEGDSGYKHIVRDKSVVRVKNRNKPRGKKGKQEECSKEDHVKRHGNSQRDGKRRIKTNATNLNKANNDGPNKNKEVGKENKEGKSKKYQNEHESHPHDSRDESKAKTQDLQAEIKSAEATMLYASKDYQKALFLYTEAIELSSSPGIYHWRRSATYIMTKQYKEALADASKTVTMLPDFAKGNLRLGRCHLLLGNLSSAISVLSEIVSLKTDYQEAVITQLELAKKTQESQRCSIEAFDKKDYSLAIEFLNACMEKCPGCTTYKTMKAECLCLLKNYEESAILTRDVLRLDSINADAVYVQALCAYFTDSDQTIKFFKDTLRLNPDHEKAKAAYKKALSLKRKKTEGNNAFNDACYIEAVNRYSETLDVDPNNDVVRAKLFCNRATAYFKIDQIEKAICDYSEAIRLDEQYLKAYLRRAKCYMKTEQYSEAVCDLEIASELNPKLDYKEELCKARTKLLHMKPKSFYQILGINNNASEAEIKKAYKNKALLHHPDRHSKRSKAFIEEQERRFKEIGEAYQVLSDPRKRRNYDSRL